MLARTNYGETFHIPGKHPRKELLEHFGRKHAEKVYRDTSEGVKHVGYYIAGRWISLYEEVSWNV